MLESILQDKEFPWNEAWGGEAVVVSAKELPTVKLPGGLRITLLSPTFRELSGLEKKWTQELEKYGLMPNSKTKPGDANKLSDESLDFEGPSDDDETEKTVSRREKTAHYLEEDSTPDLKRLAEEPFEGDTSVANSSSIAFLAEFEEASVLVGGDAPDRVLINSLEMLLSRRGEKRLRLSAFVVPHAGSHRNISVELLQLLDCDRYLISTNGALFGHPSRAAVARIIVHGRATPDSVPTLIFNYRSKSTKIWDSKELQDYYRYRAVYPPPGEEGLNVILKR
jgi:hypothetical protein